MKKSVLLFAGIIGFSILTNITWPHELPPEIEAIMNAIIQAHEAETDRLRQGAGLATVSITRGPVGKAKTEENTHVQFWFKGRSRRTDFYPLDSDISDKSFKQSRVDNGEFFYSYGAHINAASIERSGRAGFKGELTQDFHHDVFFNWVSGIPLKQTFRRMIDHKDKNIFKFEVQFTKEGLLKFIGTSNEKVKYGSQEMDEIANFSFLLDLKRSYRIVAYHFEQKNVNGPGSCNIDDMKVEWHDYGLGEVYPKSVKSDHWLVRSTEDLKNPPDGVKELDREVETHIEISVKEFQPNINIEDNIFTLKGMGIKRGTKINDQVSGILYTYGSNKVTEATLESLLNDSRSARSASDKRAAQLEYQSPRKEFESKSTSRENAVSPGVVATRKTDSTRYIITIGLIMVIIVSGALFLLRLVARKRQKN